MHLRPRPKLCGMKGMSYVSAFILLALSVAMALGGIRLVNWVGHPYYNLGMIAFGMLVMTLGAVLFFVVLHSLARPLVGKLKIPKRGKQEHVAPDA